MRKTIVMLSLALVAVGLTWAAPQEKATADEAPAASCATEEGAKAFHDAFVEDLLADYKKARNEFGPATQCPATRECPGGPGNCVGNQSCRRRGTPSRSDLGTTSCAQPGGGVFSCPSGKTVHVVTQSCDQCPCCSAQPFPCVCPIDCGVAVDLACF